MLKFPSKRNTVYIEDINREVVLKELTVGYIKSAQLEDTFDSPESALLMCGLTPEEISDIGSSVATDLYKAIVSLTYPNLEAERKQAEIDNAPEKTEAELEEIKKN